MLLKAMTPEEIIKRENERLMYERMKQFYNPPPGGMVDMGGEDPAISDNQLKMLQLRKADEAYSLAGREIPMEEAPEMTAGETQARTMSRYPAAEGGQTEPTGTMPPPDKKGDASWTNAATLALTNSMPELIKAAYQRPERPKGQSVGGGKPAFQMADPFGKRERFRSMMAQYLR